MLLFVTAKVVAQQSNLSFYVVAHQDDWQLFMGTDAFTDIRDFSEKGPFPNGKRVVIIHTTAGNLDDNDDSKPCDCKDARDTSVRKMKYWKVREAGVKNSIHLAACRPGGWAPLPYPKDEQVNINGHSITKSCFRNTVTYFMRTKTGMYDKWQGDKDARIGTVDSSTTYADWSDFVTTIYYIYQAEMDSINCKTPPEFHIPDVDKTINPNDHAEHYEAGRAGFEAAQMLTRNTGTSYNVYLAMGYNSQNMPENLKQPDAQYEAGLAAVYCMALLDHNVWTEWGPLFFDWTSRDYRRNVTTADSLIGSANLCGQDSLTKPKAVIFPNPANDVLNVRINIPLKGNLDITITDILGKIIDSSSQPFSTHNTFQINTASYQFGSYFINISSGSTKIGGYIFRVVH